MPSRLSATPPPSAFSLCRLRSRSPRTTIADSADGFDPFELGCAAVNNTGAVDAGVEHLGAFTAQLEDGRTVVVRASR